MASVEDLEQGDLLSLSVLPTVAPGEPSDGSLAIEDVHIESGLVIIVSQTCDVVQDADVEPYIQVAPVAEIDEDLHKRAVGGRLSPRLFALSGVDGVEFAAADVRVVASIDKRLIEDGTVTAAGVRLEP